MNGSNTKSVTASVMSANTAVLGVSGDHGSSFGGRRDVSTADANMAAPRETNEPSRELVCELRNA